MTDVGFARSPIEGSLVSVVIPCHNAQQWIVATLDSVAAQTYPHLEVIVVDDASTDDSISLVRRHHPQVRIFHTNGDNRGPGVPRNVGWRAAQGAWIHFLDADDLLHPDKIALQMHAAIPQPPSVALVHSPWQRFHLAQETWSPYGPIHAPQLGPDPLLSLIDADTFIATGSGIFRRSWLERVGGYGESRWLVEDVELLLKIAIAGGGFHFVASEQPLLLYRQVPGPSFSQRNPAMFIHGIVKNAEFVHQHWEAQGSLRTPQRQVLAAVYLQAAVYYAAADPARFEEMVLRLEALLPTFWQRRSLPIRLLTPLLGYRRAEKLAVAWRHAKRTLSSTRVPRAGAKL